ncbi:hypothetical protein [Chryseobacterium luquanense]|uniref:Right handed beta helix domain-containing protein n=1 Tax=Chryseobacterium luquanense TaxID=2983766 RepID=A0ABT3Y4L0_9FLAO|nr:hypothetical protein [Chryseobacterium luquanense]MCX8533079.1 hypothetical protein [Chryseobacterium luquanense]
MEIKDFFKNLMGVYPLDLWYEDSDNNDYGKTINRIQSEMGATGQILVGSKGYKISTKVTITKDISFVGLGCAVTVVDRYISLIYTDSPVLEMFVLPARKKVIFNGIHFNNTSTTAPTAGSAIRFQGVPNSNNGLDTAIGCNISHCSFTGFYDNVFADGASHLTIFDNNFNASVRYNLYIDCAQHRDQGDSTIMCNRFYNELVPGRNTVSHIYQKGSGGLKIIANKFNAFSDYSILGDIPDMTVILLVSANSFENFKKGAIKYRSTYNALRFRHINIIGNEFEVLQNNNSECVEIYNCDEINIQGNSFSCLETLSPSLNRAINLQNCRNGILNNTYKNFDNPINMNGCVSIKRVVLEDAVGTNLATSF